MLNVYHISIFWLNLTIITLIFWLITMIEVFFNKNTHNKIKTDVYECGFITINKNIFPVTLNLIILLFFVIIYEIEFILLIPFLLSTQILTNVYYIYTSLLFFFIILTLYFDIWLLKINWIY